MILARIISLIITFIISVVTTTFTLKPKPSTLELVHVIFRHGDRTNDFTTMYPKSPHVNETYYPTGIGELTNDGKRTMYKVGKSLRTRYNEHLGSSYFPGLIEARSSYSSRAKVSLLLVLAGLFPPKMPQQVWHFLLLWQPIPITYKDEERDPEFMGYSCQKTAELYTEYVNSQDYRNRFRKHVNLTNYLSENSGLNVTNMKAMARIYFGLRSESELGLELPKWSESVYPAPLKDFAPNYYADYTATIELKKIVAGFMLKKIIDDSYAKINGEASTDSNMMKMHLLSGHDINCAFMLILLGVFKPHIPPYGSQVIFELHNIDGIHGYKIYYEDFGGNEPHLLDLPDCGTFCALDKFVPLYQKYLPDDNAIC